MNIQAKPGELPPFKPLAQKPPSIDVRKKPDGTVYISSRYPLGAMHRSIAHLLEAKAAEHPERNFIGERMPGADGKLGDWRYITYGEANAQASAVAQALLDRGLGPDAPLMVISGNSIRHAVMMLGAMKARVPVAPVSVAYSLMSGDHGKLRHVAELTKPKMILPSRGRFMPARFRRIANDGIEIVTAIPIADRATTSFDDLSENQCRPRRRRLDGKDQSRHGGEISLHLRLHRHAQGRDPDPWHDVRGGGGVGSVAHRDRAGRNSAESRMDAVEPYLRRQYRLQQQSECGRHGHLDAGKPLPGMFDETIRNLREISPLVFGTRPSPSAGSPMRWSATPCCATISSRRCALSAMAAPRSARTSMSASRRLSIASTGYRIPLTTMYGATETQGITVVHWITERVGLIGLPLPGITLKLVPNGTKLEVRVKGPTVTPGYLNRPDLTKAAFDEEDFYCLGDAAKFVDENEPEKGLVFDGRVTEDFKLDSGTWVSVGTLRAQAVGAASPLIQTASSAGRTSLTSRFSPGPTWLPRARSAPIPCAQLPKK